MWKTGVAPLHDALMDTQLPILDAEMDSLRIELTCASMHYSTILQVPHAPMAATVVPNVLNDSHSSIGDCSKPRAILETH